MPSLPLRAVAVTAVALLAAGCSTTTETAPTRPAPLGAPAGLEQFYGQQVRWESCRDFGADAGSLPRGVQCARITVPLDYDDPGGETITASRS